MIKHTLAAAAVAALLMPLAAQATTTIYNVSLSGAQEVPAVITPASGTFQLIVDDVANTLSFAMGALNLMGTVAGSPGSHIHMAPAGVNGGVSYNLLANADASGPIMAGPFALPNSFMMSGSNKPVGGLAAAINAAPWNYYVNLHTTAFPGGEIRGQLAPIPEASTYAMMALGLGVLGFVARRRRAA